LLHVLSNARGQRAAKQRSRTLLAQPRVCVPSSKNPRISGYCGRRVYHGIAAFKQRVQPQPGIGRQQIKALDLVVD
jgi:hypothetical protein